MTRDDTTRQIMRVVRDFNKRGEPIYLSKLMELITESSKPTVCKYIKELIEDGKLVGEFVDNFDARGNTRVLYDSDYFGPLHALNPQTERLITEIHSLVKAQRELNDMVRTVIASQIVKPKGPVVIDHRKDEPKVITVTPITKYLKDKEEKE